MGVIQGGPSRFTPSGMCIMDCLVSTTVAVDAASEEVGLDVAKYVPTLQRIFS